MYLDLPIIDDIRKIPINFNSAFLIKKGCQNMNAVNTWNIDYLIKNFKNCSFPVEKYKNYNDFSKTNVIKKVNVPFNKIVDKIKGTNPYYYLAEQNLLDYKDKINQKLITDVVHYHDSQRKYEQCLIFFGYNSRSGCHIHGSEDYILNQIFGKKIVYLFDYDDNPTLKFGKNGSNFTEKNFYDLDHSKYKIYKVELEPGDSLLIPPWFFHAVEGVGYSCSITKTYQRTDRNYLYQIKYKILKNILKLGYYNQVQSEQIKFFKFYFFVLILSIICIVMFIKIILKKKYK